MEMKRTAMFSKIALAFVIAVGIAGGWMVALAFLGEGLGLGSVRSHETVVFTYEGKALIQDYDYVRQTYKLRTLEGEPVEPPLHQSWLTEARALGARRNPPAVMSIDTYPHVLPFTDRGSPATFWYYMQDRHVAAGGYFAGYDSRTNQFVGYRTRSGLHKTLPGDPADRFRVPQHQTGLVIASSQSFYYGVGGVHEPWSTYAANSRDFRDWIVFLVDDNRVVEVNLRESKLPSRSMFAADALTSLAVHAGLQYDEESDDELTPRSKKTLRVQDDALVASTTAELIFFHPADESIVRIARPDELVGEDLGVYRPINGNYLLKKTDYDRDAGATTHLVYTLSPTGDVLSRREIVTSRQNQGTEMIPAMMAMLVPHPLGATLFAGVLMPMQSLEFSEVQTYAAALRQSLSEFWAFVAITYVLGVFLSWRCLVRQRRSGDATVVPWMIFVFVTGLPGYLGYLAHKRWPVRLPCPSCASRTPRDREACLDCGLAFPSAELKGIEVFL